MVTLEKVFDEKDLFQASCRAMYWYNTITCERMPYYCNSARCFRTECLEHWARKRIAICNDLIKKIDRPRFFTLTVSTDTPASEAWNMVSTWWKAFRYKIRHWLDKMGLPKMVYFAILECTKKGMPHIHGFWNFYIPKKVLSYLWSKCAPGYIVDVKIVEDKKAASDYLCTDIGKYLGKKQSIDGARMAGHRKRTFWRSVGLYTNYELDNRNTPSDNKGWTLIKENSHGKTKQKRSDMETACGTISEEGTRGSIQEVDSPESEGSAMQETRSLHREEGCNERGDKEAKAEWCYHQKEVVVYETQKEHRAHTRCAGTEQQYFPYGTDTIIPGRGHTRDRSS